MAVILCDCNKKIGSRLNLNAIKSSLEAKGQKVFILNKPCEEDIEKLIGGKDGETLVVGGCSDNVHKMRFRDVMRSKGLDPFAVSTVTLISEGSNDRAVLLLTAAAERLKLFGGTKEGNLKPRFGQISGKMSRRQLFKIPKLQYDLAPSIDVEQCRTKSNFCELCVKRCESKAIAFNENRKALIEKDKCTGCGICVNVCPSKAITYPYFTPYEIIRELEVLLNKKDNGANTGQRTILFACEDSSALLYDFLSEGGSLQEGALSVIVPCIGMLDSFFLLHASALGAAGIGLLACHGENCKRGVKSEDIGKEIALADAILKAFGIDGQRLYLMRINAASEIGEALKSFSSGLNELSSGNIYCEEPIKLSYGGTPLTGLLKEISRIKAKRLLFEGNAWLPAGMVRLENDKSCTLCGVCANYCPAGALALEGEEGIRELMFSHKDCIGCASCVGKCPEKIIRMKKVIDTDRLKDGHKTSLSKEDAILCLSCGKPFLNMTLFLKIKERSGLPDAADEMLKLCPDCRQEKIFSSLL